MASSAPPTNLPPNLPPAPANPQDAKYTEFVDRRLKQTSGHVKLVDLFGGLMLLAGGLLAALFILCLIDAWVFELSTTVRVIALVAMVAVTLGYFIVRILPLLIRRINPAYAAKMIEEGHPELKNSLLNHVFFRRGKNPTQQVVGQAIHRKAAEDISRITIETAVDHSFLIRAAYFFVGALTVFGLYKILSPKDPFATVARIAAPIADISRPARVHIARVQPGDADIFFGEPVDVTATIDGLGSKDRVQLIYSTEDGQYVDQPIAMQLDSESGKHSCSLATSDSGVQQNLSYRIRAGDAVSKQYNVHVRARPSFVIQNVNVAPPAYTRLEPFEQKQGNIASVEGATVTVRALANIPIDVAFVQLLAPDPTDDDSGNLTKERSAKRNSASIAKRGMDLQVVDSISMTVSDGMSAAGSYRLQMKDDRITQRFTHYRVGFLTSDGIENDNPTLYRVRITPDLKPEIELLRPIDEIVEIPVSGTSPVEINALDPDYEIVDLRLIGFSRGVQAFDRSILPEDQQQSPQVKTVFKFVPAEFGLESGQEVLLRAVALDNRQSPVSDVPDPNVVRSRQVLIRVTKAAEQKNKTDNSDSETKQNESPADAKGDPDKQDANQQDPSNEKQQKEGPEEQGSSAGENNDRPSEGKQSGNDTSSEPQESSEGGEKSDQPQQGSDGSGESGEMQQSEDNPQDGNPSSQDQQGSGSQQSDPNNQGSGGSKSDDRDPQQKSGKGSSTGKPGENPRGDDSQDEANDRPADGEPANGSPTQQQSEQPAGNQSGTSGEGQPDQSDDPVDHPGEAFEKIKKHLDEKRQSGMQSQTNGDQAESQQAASQNAEESDDASMNDNPTRDAESGEQQTGEKQSDGNPSGTQAERQQPQQNGNSNQQDDAEQNAARDKSSSTEQHNGADKDANQSQKQSAGQKSDEQSDEQSNEQSNEQSDGKSPSESEKQSVEDAAGGNKNNMDQPDESSGSAADQKPDGKDASQQNGQPKQNQGADNKGTQSANEERSDGAGNSGSNDDRGMEKRNEGDPTGERNSDDGNSDANNKPGEESGGGKSSPERNGEGSTDSPPETNQKKTDASESSSPTGNSGGGDGNRDPNAPTGSTPDDGAPADDANLEYTRKATEMVLDYLKDQEQKPDHELLDDLNWSKDDMDRFYRKWQQMRDAAERGGNAEKQRYEDALRSLGLDSKTDRIGSERSPQQKIDGLRESGTRSKPPAHLLEEFRNFNRSRQRSR